MARERQNGPAPLEGVISIIGPGMTVVGDLETQGTVRIEGRVEGTVRAGKAVVVGKDGSVEGTVLTQDAVISGSIVGTIVAESRLEVQASARIEGDVRALRMQLEDGAELAGQLAVGASAADTTPDATRRALRDEDAQPPRAAAS